MIKSEILSEREGRHGENWLMQRKQVPEPRRKGNHDSSQQLTYLLSLAEWGRESEWDRTGDGSV